MATNSAPSDQPAWFAVRCVFDVDAGPPRTYEERITMWQAGGMDDAIALAEGDAREYADDIGATYLGLAQCFLAEEPSHGSEVFSLMRDSNLEPDAYLHRFFDTGAERQQRSR